MAGGSEFSCRVCSVPPSSVHLSIDECANLSLLRSPSSVHLVSSGQLQGAELIFTLVHKKSPELKLSSGIQEAPLPGRQTMNKAEVTEDSKNLETVYKSRPFKSVCSLTQTAHFCGPVLRYTGKSKAGTCSTLAVEAPLVTGRICTAPRGLGVGSTGRHSRAGCRDLVSGPQTEQEGRKVTRCWSLSVRINLK